MTNRTIQARVRENRGPCAVSGCLNTRSGAAGHCRRHREAKRLHGHPEGRNLLPREYAAERREVAAILNANSGHPGLRSSVEWIDAWLAAAAAGTPMISALELARLAHHGVTGARVLEEAAAVWMVAHRRPARLPDDARLTMALGTAVLRLAPQPVTSVREHNGRTIRRYREAYKADREAIGRGIRDKLGLLLHNIALTPDRTAQQKREAQRALSEPLSGAQ